MDSNGLPGYYQSGMEKVFSWTTPKEATRAEIRYWLSQSVEARVLATETIRQATFGVYDAPASRMERVYQLAQRPRR
jgi:hypothetical protein